MNFMGAALNKIKPRDDDTFFDRINYYYSTIIIIIAAAVLTAKQYVGSPVQCFVPAEFNRAWEQYAEDYCFVYNTYWVKPGEKVPADLQEREDRQLIYYQWVPFLLGLEALFFYFPVQFWAQTNTRSGLNIASMVKVVQKCDENEGTERDKAVETICRHMEDSVKLQKVRKAVSSNTEKHLTMGLLNGTYLANMYILTKLLNLFNVFAQFSMMNKFLGQNNYLWGMEILNDIRHGRDWELSGNFPRIAMCDFAVRIMANIQRFSVQCVLVVNMFNEKVFLFLYIWFLIVFVMTFFDMWRWVYMTKISGRRMAYISKFVKPAEEESLLFREFCDKIINADGVIVLKMLAWHSNELFSQQILQNLWEKFKAATQLNQVVVANLLSPEEVDSLHQIKRSFSVMGAQVVLPVSRLGMSTAPTANVSGDSTPKFNLGESDTRIRNKRDPPVNHIPNPNADPNWNPDFVDDTSETPLI